MMHSRRPAHVKTHRAPIVLLLFGEATTPQIMAALDEVAEQFRLTNLDPVEWYFPDNLHWSVLARFDTEVFESYPHVEKQLLQACPGADPSVVLKVLLKPAVYE